MVCGGKHRMYGSFVGVYHLIYRVCEILGSVEEAKVLSSTHSKDLTFEMTRIFRTRRTELYTHRKKRYENAINRQNFTIKPIRKECAIVFQKPLKFKI
jgi:hypothetical protein